jgi:hypothetical protein
MVTSTDSDFSNPQYKGYDSGHSFGSTAHLYTVPNVSVSPHLYSQSPDWIISTDPRRPDFGGTVPI